MIGRPSKYISYLIAASSNMDKEKTTVESCAAFLISWVHDLWLEELLDQKEASWLVRLITTQNSLRSTQTLWGQAHAQERPNRTKSLMGQAAKLEQNRAGLCVRRTALVSHRCLFSEINRFFPPFHSWRHNSQWSVRRVCHFTKSQGTVPSTSSSKSCVLLICTWWCN